MGANVKPNSFLFASKRKFSVFLLDFGKKCVTLLRKKCRIGGATHLLSLKWRLIQV